MTKLLTIVMMFVSFNVMAQSGPRYEWVEVEETRCEDVIVGYQQSKIQKLMNGVVTAATIPTVNQNTTRRRDGVYRDTIGNIRPHPRGDLLGNAAAYAVNQDAKPIHGKVCHTERYRKSMRIE